MLGNETDARFIRDWYLEAQADREDRERRYGTPEGWKRLGEGCYRTAFLSPEGVVYKVQHSYDYTAQSNAGEAENLRRYYLKKMPKTCRLPRWQLFELDGKEVIAMERFEKLLNSFSSYTNPGAKYWDARSDLQNVIDDQWDFHGANLAVDEENGLLVPIDLGC